MRVSRVGKCQGMACVRGTGRDKAAQVYCFICGKALDGALQCRKVAREYPFRAAVENDRAKIREAGRSQGSCAGRRPQLQGAAAALAAIDRAEEARAWIHDQSVGACGVKIHCEL